jgi:hypothetical protein
MGLSRIAAIPRAGALSRAVAERLGLGLALGALCLGAPARAEPGDYPRAMDTATLSAWLGGFGLAPEQVVSLTPLAITAIVSDRPAKGAGGEVTLRAEALNEEATARSGVLAWEMRLAVDCKRRLVRLGATTGYMDRRATGDGVPLAPSQAAWRSPPAETALDYAWRAVCDPAFQPPLLADAPVTTAPSPPRASSASKSSSPSRATTPPPEPAAAISEPPPPPPPPPRRAEPARVRAPAVALRTTDLAQVVSSSSETDAHAELTRLARRFKAAFADRETRVEAARVGGRIVYRGLVGGFTSRSEASAFCRTLKAGGQACFLR